MAPGKSVLLGIVLLTVVIIGLIFFIQYQGKLENERVFQELIQSGFDLLEDEAGDEQIDQAIQQGIQATQMRPDRKESCLLLGRAYLEKKMYNQGIEVLEEGLKELDELEFYPELNYYLGVGYSRLFEEIRQDQIWDKALSGFTEALSSPYHRSGAYFGIGALYFSRLKDNPSPFLREKATVNFQRCIDLETDMAGYLPEEPGSRCPLCRASFKKKEENDSFSKVMDYLNKVN
ncbi:MAG: hypothetical protein KJ645_03215 [Planctomycetes bacterium]|nr:hypothetical protein [Planctomycetota bacterium]